MIIPYVIICNNVIAAFKMCIIMQKCKDLIYTLILLMSKVICIWYRNALNQILRQTATHLADGPFSILVDHTRVLDFNVKRCYFRTELEQMDEDIRREELAVHVRRSHVFEDSFREKMRTSGKIA